MRRPQCEMVPGGRRMRRPYIGSVRSRFPAIVVRGPARLVSQEGPGQARRLRLRAAEGGFEGFALLFPARRFGRFLLVQRGASGGELARGRVVTRPGLGERRFGLGDRLVAPAALFLLGGFLLAALALAPFLLRGEGGGRLAGRGVVGFGGRLGPRRRLLG